MDFGHFSLMGYRERGYTSRQIFTEHGEQVKLAEQAGIEFAWFAEHHFSNYCTCPTPLMMAAHCAGFTSKIRLGTAVIVAPLYNPARVLAEIGMVDAMSNGRLALGIGSGYQPYEFERFGADLAASKAMMEEFLDILELAFSQEVFHYNGKYYQLPETHISARPIDGIKEIWIAGDNEAGHRLCARRGYIPLFAGRHKGAEYFAEMRGKIEAAYRAEGRDASNAADGLSALLLRDRECRGEPGVYRQLPPPDAPGLGAASPGRGHGRRDDDRDPVPGRALLGGDGTEPAGRRL